MFQPNFVHFNNTLSELVKRLFEIQAILLVTCRCGGSNLLEWNNAAASMSSRTGRGDQG